MARSKSRPTKSRPTKSKPGFQARQGLSPKPIMMVQIFAQAPFVIARGDTRKLPDQPVIDEFLAEVTALARRMIVPVPNDPTPVDDPASDPVPDEIRVSGVPYRVPRPQPEPQSQSEPKPQSRSEEPTHG